MQRKAAATTPPPAKQPDKVFKKVKMACVGMKCSTEGKLFVVLKEVADGELVGSDCWYGRDKTMKSYVPGSVYWIERADGTIRPQTAVLIGNWPDEGDRSEWRALAEAAKAEQANIKGKATTKKWEKDLPCLDPIRRAYLNTSINGQIAIEAMVLRYLRKGY